MKSVKIVCAAIKIRIKKTRKIIYVPCIRHGYGQQMLNSMMNRNEWTYIEDGFLTNTGRFLNRVNALKYAIDHSLISLSCQWDKEDTATKELYSEDLY